MFISKISVNSQNLWAISHHQEEFNSIINQKRVILDEPFEKF